MLFLGHRGAPHATAPENTLASIERAVRQGADGVEVDVRVTADEIAVLSHDGTLERMANDTREVSALNYAELPWLGSHRIPRVSEVVDVMAGRGRLVLEMKPPHWPTAGSADPVEVLARVLVKHRRGNITVSSFDRMRLKALRAHGLGVRTALLGRPAAPAAGVLRQALADGHEEVHLHLSSLMLRPQIVAEALGLGKSVVCWTVNGPADLAFCAALGVAAVITDDPAASREHVNPATTRRPA